MPRQFVACKFRPEDKRAYTYEFEGEPLAEGDLVKVANARTGATSIIHVVSIGLDEPSFACVAIIGKHVPEPDTLADDADLLRHLA